MSPALRLATVSAALHVLVLSAAAGTLPVPASASGKPSPATVEAYTEKCQSCHMADGDSPLEPLNFIDGRWTHGSRPEQVARVISEGVTGTAMLPFKDQLDKKQIEALAAYVRSFDKTVKVLKGKASKSPKASKGTN